MTDPVRLKKVLYRAHHRGFKEADLLLGTFADTHLHALAPAELDDLERLMEEQDQDIYDWVLGKFPVPPEHDTSLFAKLKAFDFYPRASWN